MDAGDATFLGLKVSDWINLSVAIGTLLLAFFAIYGDRIKDWWLGPKLRLEAKPPIHNPMVVDGKVRYYFYLTVVNTTKNSVAENCRVRLRKMWRLLPGGSVAEIPLAYPMVLAWPPADRTPMEITVADEERVDLGRLLKDGDFEIAVRVKAADFDGAVRAHQAVRFGFQIVSDRFVSRRIQVFEVAWNGQWSDDRSAMGKNIAIKEVDGGA